MSAARGSGVPRCTRVWLTRRASGHNSVVGSGRQHDTSSPPHGHPVTDGHQDQMSLSLRGSSQHPASLRLRQSFCTAPPSPFYFPLSLRPSLPLHLTLSLAAGRTLPALCLSPTRYAQAHAGAERAKQRKDYHENFRGRRKFRRLTSRETWVWVGSVAI